MIAYAWHSVEGFSRFGVYEGNAVADGMYIYLGFRPAILILMDITSGSNWATVDTTRSVSNPNQKRSRINTTDSEINLLFALDATALITDKSAAGSFTFNPPTKLINTSFVPINIPNLFSKTASNIARRL